MKLVRFFFGRLLAWLKTMTNGNRERTSITNVLIIFKGIQMINNYSNTRSFHFLKAAKKNDPRVLQKKNNKRTNYDGNYKQSRKSNFTDGPF